MDDNPRSRLSEMNISKPGKCGSLLGDRHVFHDLTEVT